jgi:hypothetical protein
MLTEEEIAAEIEKRAESMADIPIADTVKQEVVAAGLVMDCCYAVAGDMVGRFMDEAKEGAPSGRVIMVEQGTQSKIALALYDSVTKRALMAQQTQRMSDLQIPFATLQDGRVRQR